MIKAFYLMLLFSFAAFAQGNIQSLFAKGAEITSYKTIQPRYNEARTAVTVMVFVPEHINRATGIKVEDYKKTSAQDRIAVVKLNRGLYFNTGIYPYAVMTSVFSATQKEFGRQPFYPVKISISVSEWCGNFYSHILPDGKGARHVMHSYFEKEGDKDHYIAAPANDYYEDNLPVLIREFSGSFLKVNESREINIMPSLWESRITHKDLAYEKGVLKKESEEITQGTQNIKAFKWSWAVGARKVTYWTEADYPHRIMRWNTNTGESGERIKTIYTRYWERNGNIDAALRKELGIERLF